MKKYNCLIVGLGKIGLTYDLDYNAKNFLTHAKSINYHQDFRLLGAVDCNSKKRKLFEKHYNCIAYSSIEKVAKYNYELIIIAVPTDSHLEVIDNILKKFKPKVILCEKPLSYNLKEAKAILDLCKKKKIALFVNYIRRSDPAVLNIKQKLGSIKKNTVKGICWYNKGLLHSCTHFIDLCEYWLGSIDSLKLISRKKKFGKNDYSLDFSAKFKRGHITFLNSENYFSHYSIELFCDFGRIRYDYEGNLVYLNKTQISSYNMRELEMKKVIIKNKMNRSQLNVLNEINNFMNKRKFILCSGKDSLKSITKIFKLLDIV